MREIPCHPEPLGKLMESWKLPYTLLQWFPSYRTIGEFPNSEESPDDSALFRYNDKEAHYHPKNLVEYLGK